MTDYTGKFIFIEQHKTGDTKGDSSYNDGEYLCVRCTPATLHCVKPTGGYGGHEMKHFTRLGERPFKVIECWKDTDAARQLADDLKAFAEASGKRNWTGSVYDGAAANARSIYRMLGEDSPPVDRTIKVECSARVQDTNGKIVLSPEVNRIIKRFGCNTAQVQELVERMYYELLCLVKPTP